MFVQANPRQTGRARDIAERSSAIFQFYASLVGEAPYPSFTLAVAEADLPGGHSPAYFALLNHQLPTSPLVWRNDPVSFANFQWFFLAHELAHQWWGQAIGWKNSHEQWLSEGFAQYFAALYAAHDGGPSAMTPMLRQMRSTALDSSDQGPVYLGYRLGHIKGDGRVFRAIVYNKGAMVLHMLRRLLGDEVFFGGVRRFYTEWRFRKAGTDDLRLAMEAVSGRDLNRFFDAWIYGAATPRIRFTYTAAAGAATLRFEHLANVMEVPLTATITYRSGETQTIIVPVTDQIVERTVPLKGALRTITVNDDHAALAEIEKPRDS
jgi:predicted metalloprotease with PDZ domain